MTSEILQKHILECISDGRAYTVSEIKNRLEANGIKDYTGGQFSGSITTMMRNSSIKKVARGTYAIGKIKSNDKRCLVLLPTSEVAAGNAEKLVKYVIKPVCEEFELGVIRSDKINKREAVDYIERAELVIADITGNEPDILYETGYRAHTRKPIIHLMQKGYTDAIEICDLEYDLTYLDSVEEVKQRLEEYIGLLHNSKKAVEAAGGEVLGCSEGMIMPVLYKILNSVGDIRKEMEKFSEVDLIHKTNDSVSVFEIMDKGNRA